MIIGNKKNISTEHFRLVMNEERLERCSDYKYLGVYIDDKLSWKSHIQYVCKKISKTCGAFAKLRHCLDITTLKTVYYALVFSHLNYCNIIWGDASEQIIQPLNTLVNRIIRIMVFAPFQSSNPQQIYEELEILNLSQIHKLEKAKFMFRYKNNLLPHNFNDYFQSTGEGHQYSLRSISQQNFRTARFNTKYGKRRIQHNGPKLWNDIPTTIKETKTLKSFSGLYKAYILNSVT